MSRAAHKSLPPSHRLQRVAESLRHALAEIFARGEIEDRAVAGRPPTVSWVKMSPDLRVATIAVVPLGGKDAAETLDALESHKRELRARLAHRVNLRYAPDLRFVLDDSFDAQARIEALLRSPEVARDLGPEKPEE
jgi:ribosome-binding factor A